MQRYFDLNFSLMESIDLYHCFLQFLCFVNRTHLEVSWFWSELDGSPARHEASLPFKLQLILFCHTRLASLPLMSEEGVEPPSRHLLRYVLQYCWQRQRQRLTFASRAALACNGKKNVKMCLVIGDGCSHVLLAWHSHRLQVRCVTAQRCSRVPQGGRWTLVACMQEVWACERARFMSACLGPAAGICCFYLLARQLLTLWFRCLMRGSHKASRFN